MTKITAHGLAKVSFHGGVKDAAVAIGRVDEALGRVFAGALDLKRSR